MEIFKLTAVIVRVQIRNASLHVLDCVAGAVRKFFKFRSLVLLFPLFHLDAQKADILLLFFIILMAIQKITRALTPNGIMWAAIHLFLAHGTLGFYDDAGSVNVGKDKY